MEKLLNESFFEKALRQIERDNTIKINDFRLNPVTKPGDITSRTTCRASITYSSAKNVPRTISLIAKTLLEVNGNEDSENFQNEISLYNTALSEIERLFETIGEKERFSSRLLYYSQEQFPVIIFEDIALKSYNSVNSKLNLEETKIVAEKLASWHGSSVFLGVDNEKQKTIKNFKNNIFKNSSNNDFMKENFQIFNEELKSWSDCERYVEKFESLNKTFSTKILDIYNSVSKNGGYSVLNHGDFNYSNLLFKKENDSIKDVFFMDFQSTVWSTPAIDLYYLLYLVASDDVRINSKDKILKSYHESFVKTLEKFGYTYKIPTQHDLRLEMLKNQFIEVILAVCYLPYTFLDFAKEKNIFGQSSVELRKELFKNPEYQENVRKILPDLLTKGILD